MEIYGCLGCGFTNCTTLFQGHDYTILKCMKCGLVQKHIAVLSREEIQKLQDLLYSNSGARKALRIHKTMAKNRISILKKFKSSGYLLEIGCATGEFLEEANTLGFNSLGIDASKTYYDVMINKNLKIKYGRLEDMKFTNKFDVVSMFHVFEHIEHPLNFLKDIYNTLNEDGLLYIIVPNFKSYTDRIFGFMNPTYQQKDHIVFYSSHTLKTLLHEAKFEIIHSSSKEYVHNAISTILSYLYLKSKKNHTQISEKSGDIIKLSIKPKIKNLFRSIPYFLGYLLFPITRIYVGFAETNFCGHELICIAKKSKENI